MGAPGLNELKNKFALTPSSQTSSSGSSLQVQLLPSILCTEGGPLAKFLGIVCPLMRGCLLNISLHHTWKLPTKINSFLWKLRNKHLLPDSSLQFGENSSELLKEAKRKWKVWFQALTLHLMEIVCLSRFFCNIRDYKVGYSLGSTKSTSALDRILWLNLATWKS